MSISACRGERDQEGELDLHFTVNSISADTYSGFDILNSATTCLDMSDNSVTGFGYGADLESYDGSFEIVGGPSENDFYEDTQVEDFLNGQNTLSGAVQPSIVDQNNFNGFTGVDSCPQASGAQAARSAASPEKLSTPGQTTERNDGSSTGSPGAAVTHHTATHKAAKKKTATKHKKKGSKKRRAAHHRRRHPRARSRERSAKR